MVALGDAAWTATSDSAHLQFHQVSDPDEGSAAQRVTQDTGASQVTRDRCSEFLIVLVSREHRAGAPRRDDYRRRRHADGSPGRFQQQNARHLAWRSGWRGYVLAGASFLGGVD